MFLHQLREDFVLALELLLGEGDPLILGVSGASGAGLEGGGAVLEELLLPAVEDGGVDAVLVTQIRDGDVFEEIEPQEGHLLLGGESLASLLGPGKTSARNCSLFERAVLPIPSEAGHRLDIQVRGACSPVLCPAADDLTERCARRLAHTDASKRALLARFDRIDRRSQGCCCALRSDRLKHRGSIFAAPRVPIRL